MYIYKYIYIYIWAAIYIYIYIHTYEQFDRVPWGPGVLLRSQTVSFGPRRPYMEGHERASHQSISNDNGTSRKPMKSIILEGQIVIVSHPRFVYKQNT